MTSIYSYHSRIFNIFFKSSRVSTIEQYAFNVILSILIIVFVVHESLKAFQQFNCDDTPDHITSMISLEGSVFKERFRSSCLKALLDLPLQRSNFYESSRLWNTDTMMKHSTFLL